MPAIVKAQTIKQAKASYKARGRLSLTEKESRQLERAIELEARAERAREAEKKRAEAAKKRAQQEKKTAKPAVNLGSQRRTDRFGFLASQFHLGAFFGKPKDQNADPPRVAEAEDEDFDDGDLDDEELLSALRDGPAQTIRTIPNTKHANAFNTSLMPLPPPRMHGLKPASAPLRSYEPVVQKRGSMVEDLDNFWEELDSGTQIARELSSPEVARKDNKDMRAGSFNSTDLDDLTAEDLDLLDPSRRYLSSVVHLGRDDVSQRNSSSEAVQSGSVQIIGKIENQMPPPPPPLATKRALHNPLPLNRPVDGSRAPSLKTMQPHSHSNPPSRGPSLTAARSLQPQNAIKGPFVPASTLYCSPDLGFTAAQLEMFVDDDLQLTQAVPG